MDNLDTIIPELWQEKCTEDKVKISFFDLLISRIYIPDWLKIKWDIKEKKGSKISFKTSPPERKE